MNKCISMIIILTVIASLFAPVSVVAIGNDSLASKTNKDKDIASKQNNGTNNSGSGTADTQNMVNNYDQPQNCDSLLGNPDNEDSVAWLVQKILNYIQVIGPLLVVILSSIDFAKVIIQSDDEAMAKATKKLTTRLILAASLFFLPVIVKVLLSTFGLTSDPTCGLK